MTYRFLDIAASAEAHAEQERRGSRGAYARLEGQSATPDTLGEKEIAFISARDSFYVASVNQSGWPYIQHRGGRSGFLKIVDNATLGFADLSGNRQYLTVGNIVTENRVALFLMDYPNRRRMKLLGRMTAIDLQSEPAMAQMLIDADYPAKVERGFRIAIEAFDWNCPQHITQRYTEAELAQALLPMRSKLDQLTLENQALRERITDIEQETLS